LSKNVESRPGRFDQYMSAHDREKLIRDYIRARDGYRKAMIESRRAYEELIRRGLIPDDNEIRAVIGSIIIPISGAHLYPPTHITTHMIPELNRLGPRNSQLA
jgi:hypothetical protein